MRATQAPEQWRKLLDAVDNKDYDLAHHICVTYKFNGDSSSPTQKNVPVGHYLAMAPDGTIYHDEFGSGLSRKLNMSDSYVKKVIAKDEGVMLKRGKFKGWRFWKQ